MLSGQRAAHLITSPKDVLRDFSPSVQWWLSTLLSLSVSTGCWTEPYISDPGQGEGLVVREGVGGWVRGHNGNAY